MSKPSQTANFSTTNTLQNHEHREEISIRSRRSILSLGNYFVPSLGRANPMRENHYRRPSVALSIKVFHSLPVANFIVSVWPMAHVMRNNVDSIMCAASPNQMLNLRWVATLSVETRRESLCHA